MVEVELRPPYNMLDHGVWNKNRVDIWVVNIGIGEGKIIFHVGALDTIIMHLLSYLNYIFYPLSTSKTKRTIIKIKLRLYSIFVYQKALILTSHTSFLSKT